MLTPRQRTAQRLAAAQAARLELFYADPPDHRCSPSGAWWAIRHAQPVCDGCRQAKRDYERDRAQRAKEITA